MHHLRFSSFALACALASGCSQSVESTDIRTTGVYPEITVTATGSGTSKVEVQLKVGGSSSNTYLDLTGDDQLKATVAGTAKFSTTPARTPTRRVFPWTRKAPSS